MDTKLMKESIDTNVYHIPTGVTVPLHGHQAHDEVFYCIEGSGYGLLQGSEVKLTVGDVFVAHAGDLHGLRSDDNLHVVAVMIPVDRVICKCKNVSYGDIRNAMMNGARTIDEIKDITNTGTGCGSCIADIEEILIMVCGCKGVSKDTVLKAIKGGADTVEKVSEVTEAGTGCGKCKVEVQALIDTNK